MCLCSFKCRRLTRTKLFVNLEKSFLLIFVISFSIVASIFSSSPKKSMISSSVPRPNARRNVVMINLSVLINTNIEKVIYIGFIFKPSTAVWNNGLVKSSLPVLSCSILIINARRSYKLRYDTSFSTVDNECACICHQAANRP